MMEARATFPPEPTSATAARHFAERTLAAWGIGSRVDTARLLVSELVINSVLHAGTDTELVLEAGPSVLRVEVADGSVERPVVQRPGPSASSGRGLLILDDLADRWGVEVGERGKTVWFELRLGPVSAGVERGPGG